MIKKYKKWQRWNVLRQQVIERDKTCRICGEIPTNPHIHHITYIRRGHEDLIDLELMCEECHMWWHNDRKSGG